MESERQFSPKEEGLSRSSGFIPSPKALAQAKPAETFQGSPEVPVPVAGGTPGALVPLVAAHGAPQQVAVTAGTAQAPAPAPAPRKIRPSLSVVSLAESGVPTPVSGLGPLPTEIVPGLYLGDVIHAADEALLRRIGITHVLNCCGDFYRGDVPGIHRMSLDIQDTADFPIMEQLPRAIEFIAGALKSGGRILVHCQKGKSRSVTVVAAYLMSRCSALRDARKVLAYMCRIHPASDPNLGFIAQLESYAKLLDGEKHAHEKTPLQMSSPSLFNVSTIMTSPI